VRLYSTTKEKDKRKKNFFTPPFPVSIYPEALPPRGDHSY
jgi:hypothetical protein